jgi:hypothetical protein
MVLIVGIFLKSGCIEPYSPPEIVHENNYLVVEGHLDAATGSSIIKISQTTPLTGSNSADPITNALVVIEDELNQHYLFTEHMEGVYVVENIPVDSEKKYRIKIINNEDEYTSSYVEVTNTPAIDSVFWRVEGDKIRVYVNTHNDQRGTGYYFWRFNETWEYSSAFRSYFKLEEGLIKRRDTPNEIYYCWKTDPSNRINIATSLALKQDVISNYLLREYDLSARQFQIKYSIQVMQYSLTKEAYEFWSQVRDNTQSMATLFDVQPSRVTGNISNKNGKPAIGYFAVSNVQEVRIFIHSNELPSRKIETGYEYCRPDTLLWADIPSFDGHSLIIDELYQHIDRNPPPGLPVFLGYAISSSFCVDCRRVGGSTVRPDFWD